MLADFSDWSFKFFWQEILLQITESFLAPVTRRIDHFIYQLVMHWCKTSCLLERTIKSLRKIIDGRLEDLRFSLYLILANRLHAAIVTSTSTPASILIIICFTTSVGAFRLQKGCQTTLALHIKIGSTYSINLLWILISKVSQVFDPSQQGVCRVVT